MLNKIKYNPFHYLQENFNYGNRNYRINRRI